MFYVVSDQVKSTSVLVNQDGTVNSRNYYYPYGGNRGGTAFSGLTTKRFTGQYHEQGLPGGEGLSYYNARWYDSYLNRWIQPDTIVPDPYNPQSLNRYSYVLNNPLRYTDPTGHAQACADGDEGGGCGHAATPAQVLATVFDSHLMDLYLWSYMRTHPSYDPASDPALEDDASRFLAANAQFQVLNSPLRPTDPTIDIKPLLAAGGTLASFAVPLDPPGTQSGNAMGGRIHSRYADGTPVYRKQEPPHITGPLPEAQGPHTVLRWDKVNNRIYQARTYDAAGNPVLDVDFTKYPKATHEPGPPHVHTWQVNDSRVGPQSGWARSKVPQPFDLSIFK